MFLYRYLLLSGSLFNGLDGNTDYVDMLCPSKNSVKTAQIIFLGRHVPCTARGLTWNALVWTIKSLFR
jgi:hypothetical protein